MKKTLSIALICLFFAFNLSAQTVTFGAENESDKYNFNPVSLLGKFDNNYFVMMRESRKFFIQRYALNDNLKMGKEIDVKAMIGKDEIGYTFSFMSKNVIHVFYTVYAKKEELQYIFLQSYDENLAPKGTLRMLTTIGGRSRSEAGKFRLLKSPTENKVCLVGEDDFKDNDPQKFSINVFDAFTMEEEWSKKVTLPYTDKLFIASNFNLTDEGTVSILGKKFNEKLKEKKNGKVNYTFEAFVYTKENNGQQKTISLNATTYMTDVRLFSSKTNALNIIGFYGETAQQDVAKGVFTMTLDKEMNNTGIDQKPFTAEFLATFSRKSKRKKEIYQFDIKTVTESEDGNIKVVAEQSFTLVERNQGANGSSYTITTDYDMDMMVLGLDKNLKISNKMQKISKEQETVASMQSFYSMTPNIHSYVAYKNGNDLYLLYNDNIKNKDFIYSKDVKEMSNRKPSFFMIKIDANNNLKKEELFGKQENKFLVYPKFSKQINEKEVLIYAERGKKYSFGIIKFE